MFDSRSFLNDGQIQIYADCAGITDIARLSQTPFVAGFTTNPTLMRNAGVSNYKESAKVIIEAIGEKPISFEVFADEFDEMERQAAEITTWGSNVYTKIPITNTKRESSAPLIRSLVKAGIKVNVTAIMTSDQVLEIAEAVSGETQSIVSVFAGRIADTGVDPVPVMQQSLAHLKSAPNAKLLWASTRELLNIYQAVDVGCHIITVTPDILAKTSVIGKDLDDYSAETVSGFYRDAQDSGYTL